MSADIRLAFSFRAHPKRVKLQKRLGADGVLAFIDLMLFAGESRPDGSLAGMTPEDVAIAAQWKGDPEELLKGLHGVGLLDKKDGHFSIHDWTTHNSYAANATSRKFASARAAHIRWLKERGIACSEKRCKYCGGHAQGMRGARKRNAPVPSPTPTPSPAHTTRAREAADAWNAMVAVDALGRPAVTEDTIAALTDQAEKATAAILKLRPDFTWMECIGRIDRTSWLVREAQSFSFEWLFKRDQSRTEWNAVKVWDRRLGAPETGPRQFKREGDEPVFDSKGFATRVVE